MGFFNWFSAKPAPVSSGLQHTDIHATLADATRPIFPANAKQLANKAPASPSTRLIEQRRTERNARRELLFQVVRESMVRVGILSAAFKFKVLALDQRGRTFLVMIDLSTEFAGETSKLAEIEALIAQTAKSRYELIVQAVYWRFYDTIISGSAIPRAQFPNVPASMMGATVNTRAPSPTPSMPAAAPPAPVRSPVMMPGAASAEPVEIDEVEAFKRALTSGAKGAMRSPLGGPATPAAKGTPAPVALSPNSTAAPRTVDLAAAAKASALAAIHNKLLLTGYEDTEMHDDDPAPALSITQYGELR
jgi:hypothetical protein